MKPTELSRLPLQTLPRPPAGTPVKSAGGALQSAETVVAPAGRKKAASRPDSGVVAPETSGKPVTPLVEDAGIGQAKAAHAGPLEAAFEPDAQEQQDARATEIIKRRRTMPGRYGAIAAPPNPEQPGADSEPPAGLRGAVAFDARAADDRIAMDAASGAEREIVGLPDRGTTAATSAVIPGIGDRMHHLAMVAAPGTPSLRPLALARKGGLAKLRPKSRTECEQRCGCDGFCDPSDALGCGGIFCGRRHDGV